MKQSPERRQRSRRILTPILLTTGIFLIAWGIYLGHNELAEWTLFALPPYGAATILALLLNLSPIGEEMEERRILPPLLYCCILAALAWPFYSHPWSLVTATASSGSILMRADLCWGDPRALGALFLLQAAAGLAWSRLEAPTPQAAG